ncbi:MAG: hypothetical protein KAT57_02605 [Candidatus Lokiarchaeota archaeon]|nr:hypothetical protein [Candidatus Lokiarchaeota archaeon]
MIIDITERKILEHELKISEERYRNLTVGNLENINPDLKNLVLISDNKNKNDLFKLREKLKLEIVNYYNLPDVGIK